MLKLARVLLASGIPVFRHGLELSWLDAWYFPVTTLTMIGYGDISLIGKPLRQMPQPLSSNCHAKSHFKSVGSRQGFYAKLTHQPGSGHKAKPTLETRLPVSDTERNWNLIMKQRLLVTALLGSLHSLSSANPPSVPSYWVSAPIFNPYIPDPYILGGISGGLVISGESGGSAGFSGSAATWGSFAIDASTHIFIGTFTPAFSLPGIDTNAPFYPISELGSGFTPDFRGGTLRIDVSGTYANNFTINNQGGTIDGFGHSATFTGVFSDAVVGMSGPLTFTNSGVGGSVTLAGANTYTGLTTINSNATLALAGSGSIANSSGLVDNGTFDISGTDAGAAITTLASSDSGIGTVELGAKTLTLTNAAGIFKGAINGVDGGLTLAGGHETLTGVNTYSGLTTINAGATLGLTGSGSIANSSSLMDNGSFDISGTDSGVAIQSLSGIGTVNLGAQALTIANAAHTFSGAISGTGGLVLSGGTETFGGGNTYTGLTTINSGTTLGLTGSGSIANSSSLSDNGNFDISTTTWGASIQSLSGTGTVNLGAQYLTLTNAAATFNGVISGLTGGLSIAGGNETLTNTHSYSGLTTINADATLNLTESGSIANSLSVADNGNFDIAGTTSGASIKSLSGSGAVNLGTQALTITNASHTFSGVMGGTGSLMLSGGTETFGGVNTYTGLTTINSAATLGLTGLGGIANSSSVADNGSFDISTTTSGASIQSLSGNGVVYLGAQALTITHAAHIFSGSINGTGNLTLTGGTETFSGTNTYSGLTTINSNAALDLTGSATMVNSTVVDNGSFDISGTTSGTSIQSLSGNGTVNLGAQNLAINYAAHTFSGAIGGTGGLTLAGGTETFDGVNTYTGSTTINANSTLALTGIGSIANSSGVVDNGNFDISGTNTGASIKTLSGTGTVALGTQTLNLTQAADTFSGTLTGTGGLTVIAGVETLNGYHLHNYSGLTTINSGATLALAGSGIIDNLSGVVANGLFDLSGLTNYSGYIASLSGNGSTHLGGNALFLGHAAGSFAGTIDGITESAGGLGLVVLNGTETLSGVNTYTGMSGIDNGATLALAGAGSIANSSGVGLVGGGTFDISGASAGVSIQNLLSVASAQINTSSTVNLGANTLTLSNAGPHPHYDPFFAGSIVGTGGLTIAAGSETLAGINTYSGLTTINSRATLALVGAGSIAQSSGVVVNGVFDISGTHLGTSIQTLLGNGTVLLGDKNLTLNGSNPFNFGGNIVGTGTLEYANNNSSSLDLTGVTTLAGGLLIKQGTLKANGVINSPVNIALGATLHGTGTLNGSTTVSGTLAPGNSPGTLTSNATVALTAGSVFLEDIDGLGTGNGAGNYSRLLVNGAGSQFIADGTLTPALRGISGSANNTFIPSLGDGFRFVTAQGGIVGRFARVVQPVGLADGTQLDVFYNRNSIDLFTTPTSYASLLSAAGVNGNGWAVGGVLDGLRGKDAAGQANAQQNDLRYAVAALNAGQLPQVAVGLAGEVHGAMAAAAPETGRWLQTSVARQLAASPGLNGEDAGLNVGDRVWVDFNASQSRSDSDASAFGYSASRYQFAVGVDILRSQANRLGIGATYASTSVAPQSGSGHIEETAPFLYGQYVFGKTRKVIVDGLFSYGVSTWETDRPDPLRRAAVLRTKADGNSALFGVGLRSPWALGGFTVEPFARVLWQNASRRAINEGSASPSALSLSEYSMNGTRLFVGAAVGSEQSDPLAVPLTYRASLAFGNDFGDLVYPSVHANLAGETISINSPHVGRQFGQLNLSATYRLLDNAYAYVGLNGEARSNRIDGGVNAGFSFKF